MGLWTFHCTDGEHGAELRKMHLREHLDHIRTNIDRYAVAGPLRQGDRTVGSLLVIVADSEQTARSYFESDPYFHAGVWQAIRCSAFSAVAGEWVGGVSWE